MEYAVVSYKSSDYTEMLELRKRVLRDPLGLKFSSEELQLESEDCFLVCRDGGQMIACCILARITSEQVKLRQMAVHPFFQRKSVGSGLLLFAEQYAGKAGYSSIILHARETAVGFYGKHHYRIIGNPFVEVGIQHVAMQKDIAIYFFRTTDKKICLTFCTFALYKITYHEFRAMGSSQYMESEAIFDCEK